MQVIKKDGTLEEYNEQKIINAVNKSARRAMVDLTEKDYQIICNAVWEKLVENDLENTEVYEMHNIVETVLSELYPIIAKKYTEYRNYKKDFVHMMDKVYERSQSIRYIGDKSNANTDSALVATKRSLIYNELSSELYKKFFLTVDEKQAMRDGYIYIHDRSARLDTWNCCLCRIGNIMQGGFEMGNVWYNEPNSLDTAFDVMGDIILATAAQQYGGFTVPEVDKILAPYAEKSYKKYIDEYRKVENDVLSQVDWKGQVKDEGAINYATEKVRRDFEQGWQGIEYKLNTVGSSRGDYPFVTMTIGLATDKFGKMASISLLKVHSEGQGKKGFKRPVLFPKIVFLYDENLHGDGGEKYLCSDVFKAGIECSSKTMYPDWLSLTGDGYVPEMYKKYGRVVSPMGCVDGKEVITYKYNDNLYVESFERMWSRLSDSFEPKQQINGQPHLYMDLFNVEIYDTEKGFVDTKRIIRNVSDSWVDLHLSNGRRLLCTSDHPITTTNNITKRANELKQGENILINSSQFTEENIIFNKDKAWLLGFLLCDGCYQSNHIFASIAAEGEDEIEKKFHTTFKKYFDMNTKTVLQERGKKGTYKDLVAIADENNNLQKTINYLTEKFGGINKVNRHIPNDVFSWDYESKLAFLAGMIDADGYINSSSNGVVQIGSTNKELALQQMALAQSLGMPSKIYHNHYTKKNPNAIRYRVEFYPIEELISYIVCQKKKDNYSGENDTYFFESKADVMEVIPVKKYGYSYDVTTDSEHFEVSGIYSHNCRAFLSPWYERGGMYPIDEDDKPVFEGRFNCGVISLHLPMILAKSRQESKDFYEVLDYYLELIRNHHKRTIDYLGELRASTNPVMFCEGGLLGGNLKPEDKIKPLLKAMTISYGITALNELQQLYNGKSIREDGQFALEVMQYIQNYVDRIKEEDQILYAIYGTPAESLCGLQVEQFRKMYGIIENVSDKPYVSNSFHCHVSENMSPIEKQDKEERFWNLFNGGKIQYCRYNLGYNKEAIKTLVLRAMKKGFYEGVNLAMCYCEDCGYQQVEMDTCPKCRSKMITKIDRMNGYLGFTRVHGDTRYNEAKNAEITDRKSM